MKADPFFRPEDLCIALIGVAALGLLICGVL